MLFNTTSLRVHSVSRCVAVILGYLAGMESLRLHLELTNHLFVAEVEECSLASSGCGSAGRVPKRADCISSEGCVQYEEVSGSS